MSRIAKKLILSEEERCALDVIVRRKKNESRLVQRARIILLCSEGVSITKISERLGLRPNTIINRRDRFLSEGMDALYDRPRAGRPCRYDKKFRNDLLRLLEQPPPNGQSSWDGGLIAKQLNSSKDAVWRVLKKEGISLKRQRSWCVSTDPEFAAKAAEIIGFYLNPPSNAVVISVDEKPSMQALERSVGYVKTTSGKIVRGLKSTYKRHGTVNLFAALNIATGAISGKLTETKKRIDFQDFMEEIVAAYAPDQEIHVILDNYCTHKKNEQWLANHPNVTFHFTPTSASWLNQIEIWFGIFSRKVLRGASFESIHKLKEAVEKFIQAYNPKATPFVWKKREVKGSQLKDTIVNLCN